MKKIFNQKNFKILVGTLLDSRVILYIHFCLQVHFKVSAAWYCSHWLPPVTTTLVKLVAKLPPGINNTNETGGKICRRCRSHRGQILMLLIRVVHLDLRISPWIFKKIWNGPNGLLCGWGKLIHEKNQMQKILWHCPCSTHVRKFIFLVLYKFSFCDVYVL